MSFDKKLKQAAKLWKKAKERKPDYDNVVSDGVYTAKLIKAEMGESQKGRLQVSWQGQIINGEYKGEKVSWWSGIETEDNIMYFQRDLARLGQDVPEDPSELETVLGTLEKTKPTIRIKLTTKGEYQNVRILKLVDADEEDAEEAVEEDVEEVVEEEAEEVEENEETEEKEEVEEESEDEESEDDEAEDADDDEDAEDDEESDDDDTDGEDSEDDEDSEDEEAPEVEVGSRVQYSHKGKDLVVTVTKVNYKKGVVDLETPGGNIIKGVSPDHLSPAPKTTVKKSK